MERKRLLQEKLEQNKRLQENKRIELHRKEIMLEVEAFDKKYRFANEAEVEKIDSFIDNLNHISPDCTMLPADIKTDKAMNMPYNKMYLCFLCGEKELLKIYIYGDYKDFINDYGDWEYFSPYLMLIDEAFSSYIYITDWY